MSEAKFSVRVADLKDMLAIMALEDGLYRSENSVGLSNEQFVRYFATNTRLLTADERVFFVAEIAKKRGKTELVGFVSMDSMIDDYTGEMFGRGVHLFVSPQYRKRGIAEELIEKIIAFAKEKGSKFILVGTTEETRGIYEKRKFKSAGVILKRELESE